jgi:hypothetical protein
MLQPIKSEACCSNCSWSGYSTQPTAGAHLGVAWVGLVVTRLWHLGRSITIRMVGPITRQAGVPGRVKVVRPCIAVDALVLGKDVVVICSGCLAGHASADLQLQQLRRQ